MLPGFVAGRGGGKKLLFFFGGERVHEIYCLFRGPVSRPVLGVCFGVYLVMFAGATMPTQKRGQEWGGGRATCVSGMFRACFRYVSRPQRLLILVLI